MKAMRAEEATKGRTARAGEKLSDARPSRPSTAVQNKYDYGEHCPANSILNIGTPGDVDGMRGLPI